MVFAAVVSGLGAAHDPTAARSTWTTLEARDGKAIEGKTPATFCVFFRPGEIPKGQGIAVKAAGRDLSAQVDVKRTFEDGSVKHALISVVLPGLDATGLKIDYAASPAEASKPADCAALAKKLLEGDFDAVVTLTFPDGKAVSASARKMLEAAGDKAKTWLTGVTAIEWVLMGAPADEAGQADPDMAVQFLARYYPETGHTRVSAAVEKCSDQGSDGGIIYDVVIQRGKAKPETVFEEKGVRHADLMRWRRVFWMGAEPAELNPRMDVESMIAAAVIPPYDVSLKVPEAAIASLYARWQKVPKGIGKNGLYRPSMPDTGGSDDRGLLPRWAAMYFMTMDARLREAVIGADEMAGNAGMHGRASKTGRVETQDARPKLWFVDGRAGNWGTERWRQKPAPPRTAEQVKSVFICDLAHVPAMGYSGYLASGDFFFLEETYFWAAYSLLCYNPGYRAKVFNDSQLRGKAWGLRLGLDAALAAPDADPEKEYFMRLIADTFAHHLKFQESDQAHPLKACFAVAKSDNACTFAPWQHDFMTLVSDWAARAGFRDAARFRDGLLAFAVGRFTSAPDFNPYCGAGYWWVMAEKGKSYLTWKDLYDRNFPNTPREATGKDQGCTFGQDYIGSYTSIARAAAAAGVRTGFPKARDAYDFISKNCPQTLKNENSDPTWSFSTAAER